jgi:hypothetical protein
MAVNLPNNPVNGDSVVVNGTTYVYNSTNNSWDIPVGAGLTLPLTSLSVGPEATPSGDGAISYDNTTGIFTYTPPVILTNQDVTTLITSTVDSAYVQARQANQFYIIQTGEFTGPITGTVEFTPTSTITITAIESSIANIEVADIVFAVVKNGTVLQQFTIPAGAVELDSAVTNNTVTSSDIITLDILSGSGQDLAVRFLYEII